MNRELEVKKEEIEGLGSLFSEDGTKLQFYNYVKNSRVPIGIDQKFYKDFYNRCTEKRRKPIPTFANFNK